MTYDISEEIYLAGVAVTNATGLIADAMTRPSVLYRPALFPDGDKWCALLGENLMEGVAGFGDTPADAMWAFDKAWSSEKTPRAVFLARQAAEVSA